VADPKGGFQGLADQVGLMTVRRAFSVYSIKKKERVVELTTPPTGGAQFKWVIKP